MFGKSSFQIVLFCAVLLAGRTVPTRAAEEDIEHAPDRKVMTLEEFLKNTDGKWFLTGKKKYCVQAMMVSKEISFRNELEAADYAAVDDGATVILKGTTGELWTSRLPKVISTYTKPDGSPVSASDFAVKDVFIDLVTIPSEDSNYAMFVPKTVSVTVVTSWGDVLHTNLPNAPHGEGDYLICRVGKDGEPDLSDVWILNGVLFPENYNSGLR